MGLISETFAGMALAIARQVLWMATNPGEHHRADQLGLVLPFPPSTNRIWRPKVQQRESKERPWENESYATFEKTPEYEGWKIEAGYQPLAGRWCRFFNGPNTRHWGMAAVPVGLPYTRDASNLYKPAEDLVCEMTGLFDRYNMVPASFRLDHSKALQQEGLIKGLYLLVEVLEE